MHMATALFSYTDEINKSQCFWNPCHGDSRMVTISPAIQRVLLGYFQILKQDIQIISRKSSLFLFQITCRFVTSSVLRHSQTIHPLKLETKPTGVLRNTPRDAQFNAEQQQGSFGGFLVPCPTGLEGQMVLWCQGLTLGPHTHKTLALLFELPFWACGISRFY